MDTTWHTRPLISAWTGLCDPQYIGLVAARPVDAVVLDMQHGALDESAVLAGIAATTLAGKPTIVRVPLDRWDMVSRALDFGASAVIAPMINTAEDARNLVAAAKYVPMGARSYGPSTCAQIWQMTSADYVRGANYFTRCYAMIETREAIENLDAILDVDGLDGIFIGPGDLSISLRSDPVPDGYGPDSRDIIATAVAKTKSASKQVAAYTSTPDQANWMRGLGADLVSIGDDKAYMTHGLDTLLAQIDR